MSQGVEIQFLMFAGLGTVNTLLDFGVYNLLTRRPWHLGRVTAHLYSTGVAVCFSFAVNSLLVFPHSAQSWTNNAFRFVLVNCFSGFLLQSSIIYIASRVWRTPIHYLLKITHSLGWACLANDDWVTKNAVKGMAVAIGMIFNFLLYKFFVFKSA